MKKIFSLIIFMYLTLSAFSAPKIKWIPTTKNQEKMELVFILDKSGSMGGLESDTIGGFNSMLEKQKKAKNRNTYVTTVLFDNEYKLLYSHIPIKEMKPLTENEYSPGGTTALLDAIGKTISQVKSEQIKLSNKDKAKKVLFVIITDGMENASKEYNITTVKRLIETQKNTEKWEFIFLGANIDAIGTAQNLGIERSRAVQYKSDSIGTQNNYKAVERAIDGVRAGHLDESWKIEIEKDVKNRGQ